MPSARRLAAALLATLGCSAAEPFPDLQPLTGTVTRGGRPVEGGGLIFLPDPSIRSGLVVDAAVRADGTFEAKTGRTTGSGTEFRPGAPAGTYRAVYHPPGDGSKMNREVELSRRVEVGVGANSVALVLPDAIPTGTGAVRDDTPGAGVATAKVP